MSGLLGPLYVRSEAGLIADRPLLGWMAFPDRPAGHGIGRRGQGAGRPQDRQAGKGARAQGEGGKGREGSRGGGSGGSGGRSGGGSSSGGRRGADGGRTKGREGKED